MKKSFMTRVLATGLSLAMALSLSTATNLVSAQAAPAMLVDAVSGESTSTLTVDVDAVAKLKINPEVSKTYKVESVKKSSKKIKTAVSKNGTVVYVRGVTATEEKDSAIRVYFKVKKTGKTAKRQFAAKVKVVAPKPAVAELTEVTQKEARKFAVTLSTAVEKVDASDFSIKRKADNAVIPIKSAISDDAKTGVTIETFVDLADGKEYTFTYTAKDEAKTASSKDLTVTDGKIAKLDLTTTNVTAGTADGGVKVVTKDAGDVVLNTYSFSDAAAKYINVTVTPTTTGYRDGNKIYLPEVGNTATVKVEYHTYKYVDGKEEGALTETFTVTAVADATVMSDYLYTITDSATTPAWKSASFKENHQIAIGDKDLVVHFYFKDSKNNNKTKGHKISSSDATVLNLAAQTLAADNSTVAVAGAKEGTAYIVVKNSKDELVTTLPVTVVGKKVATTLELSTQAVSISNSSTANAISTVKAYVKDQYGNKMGFAQNATTSSAIIVPLSGPNNLNVTTYKDVLINSLGALTFKSNEMAIAVSGKAFQTKGTYVYRIDIKIDGKTVSNSLTVNVSEPAAGGANESFQIEIGADIDMVVNKDNVLGKTMEFKVAQMSNGVVYKYLGTNSIASISVKSSDGTSELKVVSGGVDAAAGPIKATTIGAIVTSGTATSNYVEKLAKKDTTYLVKIELQGGKNLTASFNVKDSQLDVTPEITNISDSIAYTDIKDVLKSSTASDATNYIKYYYDNRQLNVGTDDIVKVVATYAEGSQTMTVHSVTFIANVEANSTCKMLVTVNVEKAFTTTAQKWTKGSEVVGK